ncbi:carbamoyl-phosphate synthase large subunit [Myceligenerans pegani]|uniref:Carbamoyl phosphate synthase large chain n=1 Tax=Myceligenerans pegani TaxID=2776917 RepID=A0ABR9MV22_9MICO|nr:carbamoyl-phosphate synthase large subunit [Myceligenerans sp. TRM 65318]MBE1874975.1 carbamoyl-phosphate synthase large subunit [Myceligenerans sp. TRM 65318]MBE3017246.1 carbamoyl-phosphate synthase large subunit [Myceligenerans sp. TRM 65318]
MPRRNDISSVLVIGSGPIVIGQACEFDYSGTQACRVLKEEGLRVVLVNSNPATIMTDPEFADATYVEPITTEVLTSIIAKERPDALLPTLGGQTALNAAIALHEAGVLAEYGVELIGANIPAIQKGEDREQFKRVVERCGGESARSEIVHSVEEALEAAGTLGYPMVVRPSFTMGGLGSGLAYDEEDLRRIVGQGLHYSPTTEVLLEESILGWKEYELELMRDKDDNVVVVCSIENVDAVGVHTGDSVTVAPAMTLTDREYQKLRDIGIAVIREVGVDTGGCNIQYAVDPATGRVIVIEMNPRVSRSSALASKATGFPIAKIAAKLAVGYTLDEIPNDITRVTPASFEPTLDYVVVKVPRFAFEKFPAADDTLTTTMKSVGEAMALGRNFTEALGKALRSIDKGGVTFHWDGAAPSGERLEELLREIERPTESRLVQVQQVLRAAAEPGGTAAGDLIDRVHAASGIDPWFLDQILLINEQAAVVAASATLTADVVREAKRHGLSDAQIARLRDMGPAGEVTVREVRHALGVRPVYKTVDTCAAEFAAATPYHYSSYDQESEVAPREREAVIILGSGPNRIGQGIEFDYSCVHATLALAEAGYETVMVNCNPETVSTDYDTSDRLYFEPLTFEDVLEVYLAEVAAGPVKGIIVQLGGQTPLGLAQRLADAGLPILGTSPESIDAAEDRGVFGQVLQDAGLPAPAFGTARTLGQAREVAGRIGFPVLVRPSYVLGGRGMEIVYSGEQLTEYVERALSEAVSVGAPGTLPAPLLIDRFLDDAMEIDVDALYDGEELFLGGVMEHIEEAGIHSGDSACVLPPVSLSEAEIERIRRSTEAIARGVGVRGLLNVQYALVSDVLYVLEANPRASRTVPFVSKATGTPLAKAAARVMVGESIAALRASGLLPAEGDGGTLDLDAPLAVKEAVLPFKRFRTRAGIVVDTVLGPEMRSTGEVMGFDKDFPRAFAKSQAAAFGGLPTSGTVFVSVADRDKRHVVFPVKKLAEIGFTVLATSGTATVLRRNGIEAQVVRKYSAGKGPQGEPTIVDLILDGQVDLVVNSPSGQGARADGYEIRAATTATDRPIVTTVDQLAAAVQGIEAVRGGPFAVASLQEHTAATLARRAAAGTGEPDGDGSGEAGRRPEREVLV